MNEEWDVMPSNFGDFFKSSTNEFVVSLFRQEVVPYVRYSQDSTKPRGSSSSYTGAHMLDQTSSLIGTPPHLEIERRFGVLAEDVSRLDDSGRNPISQRALPCFLRVLRDASTLAKSLNTNLYIMFSLNSNDRRAPRQFSTPCVRAQVQALGIPEIIDSARSAYFSIGLPFSRFYFGGPACRACWKRTRDCEINLWGKAMAEKRGRGWLHQRAIE